ncbi:MAG: DUF2849 domain-containing protein [Pseudomonadota bacterium]
MAKTFVPAVLTASDLLDGDAVWWTGEAWSQDIAAARVALDEDARASLEAEAALPRHEAAVVGPYLVDVEAAGGAAPRPLSRREAIRADREPTFAYAPEAALDEAA